MFFMVLLVIHSHIMLGNLKIISEGGLEDEEFQIQR